MSWDVILLEVPAEIETADDFPDDFYSELGEKSQVLAQISLLLPEIDLADPTWGILNGGGFHIEFNIGGDDPIRSIMLHVRGGDRAVGVIEKICIATGWRALDTTTGDFINFQTDPMEGLREWRNFRDQVVAQYETEGQLGLPDARANEVETPNIEKKE